MLNLPNGLYGIFINRFGWYVIIVVQNVLLLAGNQIIKKQLFA